MMKAPEDRYESIADAVTELQAIAANPRAFAAVVVAPPAPRADEEETDDAEQEDEQPRPAVRNVSTLWMVLAGLGVGGVVGLLTYFCVHH